MKNNILIIEDEKTIANGIAIFLKHKEFEVVQVNDGFNAKKALVLKQFDIVLLDIMLPDIRGDKLIKDIKEKQQNCGIIFLTALGTKENIVDGFLKGADDYVTKPFDLEILFLRINSVLRRIEENKKVKSTVFIGNLEIDLGKNDVRYNEKYAMLTSTEFSVFYYLYKKKNYAKSDEILNYIYGEDGEKIETRTISVHMTKVRKKLKKIGVEHLKIKTKYKEGYKLEIEN